MAGKEKTPMSWQFCDESKDLEQELSEKYDLLNHVAEGGYGKVFRIREKTSKKIYALKVLIKGSGDEAKMRFRQEAEILERCTKDKIDNIIRLHENGMNYTRPYIIMDYVEGKDLADILNDKGRLHFPRILNISKAVLSDLNNIHQIGLVHRDIKPSNILIDKRNRRQFIIDFGIAKDTTVDSSITTPGRVPGTPPYMSPEQFQASKNVDFRSDIYSYGVVVYKMITGEVPFYAATREELIAMILNSPVPDVLGKNPYAPPEIREVINKAMHKDPEQRYGSADEFLEALKVIGDSVLIAANEQLADRYEFDEDIDGSGSNSIESFAHTYKGFHIDREKKCLLKIFDFDFTIDNIKKSVSKEKEIKKELDNRSGIFIDRAEFFKEFKSDKYPNIVEYFGSDYIRVSYEDGVYDIPFLAVEYIDGPTLYELIKKEGPLKPSQRLFDITEGILTALSVIHEKGYTYYEVFPEKIMIQNVKDRDTALLISAGIRSDVYINQVVGETKSRIAKRLFAISSDLKMQGPAADICLFGILLYKMMTGDLSYENGYIKEINAKLEEPFTGLNGKTPVLPDRIKRIVKKAITEDVNDRYGSAAAILADMKEVRESYNRKS